MLKGTEKQNMFESILGRWTDSYISIGGEAVHVSDCFHVSCERNLFLSKTNYTPTISCLKANYLHISIRLQPLFFRLLSEKSLIFAQKCLTGKFKTVIKEASGIRLEQVTDLTRRSRTESPEEIVFSADTINKYNLPHHKLKPEDLQIKYRRIKLGIRDRRRDSINLALLLFAETTDGWVLLGEWASKPILVRFGNVADHPDLKGITAKDRERELTDLLFSETSRFQKVPSRQIQNAANNQPSKITSSIIDELWNNFLNFT
ncbi:hypothetical protein HDV06_001669 [Boothiomyces sp. JEL0866]|nr:hypothetical protein HDV06_001669 [Boothiomyces sp. JEL0866]